MKLHITKNAQREYRENDIKPNNGDTKDVVKQYTSQGEILNES